MVGTEAVDLGMVVVLGEQKEARTESHMAAVEPPGCQREYLTESDEDAWAVSPPAAGH